MLTSIWRYHLSTDFLSAVCALDGVSDNRIFAYISVEICNKIQNKPKADEVDQLVKECPVCGKSAPAIVKENIGTNP